jgi:hypothetical protein
MYNLSSPSLPSATLGKTFTKCYRGFVECLLWHGPLGQTITPAPAPSLSLSQQEPITSTQKLYSVEINLFALTFFTTISIRSR